MPVKFEFDMEAYKKELMEKLKPEPRAGIQGLRNIAQRQGLPRLPRLPRLPQ